MFLCVKCYPKLSDGDPIAEMGYRSIGRCERCKKSAVCLDVHIFKLKKKESKSGKKKFR